MDGEKLTTREETQLLDAWLDMAQAFLGCGAEIRRVETALGLLAESRGALNISAFTINSYISLTCTFRNGDILTQSRRIISAPSTDLYLLEKLNALSRSACLEKMEPARLKKEICRLKEQSFNPMYEAGGMLAAFSFALFFGSSLPEAFVSGAAGLFLCFLQKKAGKILPNAVFTNFAFALITGCLVCLLCRFAENLSPGRILIGDIMLLIPGIAITNATRDIMIGDTISGTMRFAESLLWAGALAVGFVAAFLLIGGL